MVHNIHLLTLAPASRCVVKPPPSLSDRIRRSIYSITRNAGPGAYLECISALRPMGNHIDQSIENP